ARVSMSPSPVQFKTPYHFHLPLGRPELLPLNVRRGDRRRRRRRTCPRSLCGTIPDQLTHRGISIRPVARPPPPPPTALPAGAPRSAPASGSAGRVSNPTQLPSFITISRTSELLGTDCGQSARTLTRRLF